MEGKKIVFIDQNQNQLMELVLLILPILWASFQCENLANVEQNIWNWKYTWNFSNCSHHGYRTGNTDMQVTIFIELRKHMPKSPRLQNWEYRCPSHHVYRTENTYVQVTMSTELRIQMPKSSHLQNWEHICPSHHVYRTENTDVQ